MELAPQPGSEIWPVLLQLLIVRGNCKKLWGWCGGRGGGDVALSDPGLPLWGRGGGVPRGRWGPREDGSTTPEPPRVTLYWSLGLRRFQGSGLFFRSQLRGGRKRVRVSSAGARTLEPKVTPRVSASTPAISSYPGAPIYQRLTGERAY